ncbi:hypothetical protein [Clostridium sp. HBUAS56017]|uniref:hypothetical protein n=1 Tax=Clostridium sp. HBUAS56017 TaxID=2571128 RepID=UPI001177FF0D|nr:hypothetical protein [Clostridium sp. HBUAS56017]
MNIESKIENTIVNEVFKLFTQDKFQEGKMILKKIYLQSYSHIKSLRVRRLLIHNLAWVEDELGEVESSKIHIKMIKDELENDPDYIDKNISDYCLILNLYCEIFKDEININEYKEINLFISNYHHENGSLGREYVALANVYLIDKKWDNIISLVLKLKKYNVNKYFIDGMLEALGKHNVYAFHKAYHLLNGGEVYV